MSEPAASSEGKAVTNKKSFASKNLNTALQAVASKAEPQRAPPPSNAGRLTVIASKHSSQPQGVSGESTGKADGLKNMTPVSGQQQGGEREERPHPESPRGGSSSGGLPRASNIWSSRQHALSRSAAPASHPPPYEGRADDHSHHQQGAPAPPVGPSNERWGAARKDRGSLQDARGMDRGGEHDGYGYGYGRHQDSRRGGRPPGSPEGGGAGGGWGGSRWGENKNGRPGPEGAGMRDYPRQPPMAGGWGRSSSWNREREMDYGGHAPSNGGAGWGRASSSLSYSSQGPEEGDSGSGWGEHPGSSSSWGSGWGQAPSLMRPQEPPQTTDTTLPPPPPPPQSQQHYLYNHQTDSMQPAANAPPPHHQHHHPHSQAQPPAVVDSSHQSAAAPAELSPPAPRKPSGPVMGTVQILRAEPGTHHAPGPSPPKPTTPREAHRPPHEGGEGGAERSAPQGPVPGHEGQQPAPKQAQDEPEKPAMPRERSNSTASGSGAPPPRHAGRGKKMVSHLDQPWERVALPAAPHAKGFKPRGGAAASHEEGGVGDGQHKKHHHARPPPERDMSEEAVARREARRKERETRGPRIKGVLYQRMPDGKIVLVDPPGGHKGKENGGAQAGAPKEKEGGGHGDNQHSKKGGAPHGGEGGKHHHHHHPGGVASSGKAKGGKHQASSSSQPRQQPAPVVQVSITKEIITGKPQKQQPQQQPAKGGTGGKA